MSRAKLLDNGPVHILICNDDGIHAPGIAALVKATRQLGDITVVAPEAEQSAVGHAITIASPLKVAKVKKDGQFFGHAVSGTPADCVKLAVSELLPTPPDLILSGINLGANAGISVIYSGTVSGATEGTILGYPSIAFSLCTFVDPHWDTAIKVARTVVSRFADLELPPDSLLNVNIPNLPYDQLKGYIAAPVGKSRWVEEFDARTDPRGNDYYWMDGVLKLFDDNGSSDVAKLREGYVTLTPLHIDLTNHAAMDGLARWPIEL